MSGQIARLFREYSITRRRMLLGWRKGKRIDNDAFGEAEQWQRHLWMAIFAADGSVRPDWIADADHRWMLLPDGFDAASAALPGSALAPVLHVFGLAYAGPEFAQIFARLGELSDLHIYALNPCLEFWEDVDIPGGIARDSWVHRRQRLDENSLDGADPFGLDIAGDNPSLRLWARPGREYIRLLNELTDCDFDAHFTHPATGTDSAATLLHRLQESILIREPERQPASAGATAADKSIRFLACPGVRREAEIAANAIWSLVQEKTSGAPLRFHEIAVLVPDRAHDEYLPHLEAAFAELHEIPVNVVSRRFATESRVAEAIALLLRLPAGRFTRDEMLHLLTHPAIAGAAADTDPEQAAEWCAALGVFFGADRDDLAGTYIPDDLYHWDQALKRLALGAFMAGEPSGESRFFDAPRGHQYLPHEVPQDEVPSVASFVRAARNLLSDAREIRSRRATLDEWGRALGNLILAYVRAPDPTDERIRDHCVSAIESIAAAGVRSEPVSCEAACESATGRISDVESRRGQFDQRGVAIGSLAAMRSIPFRVIFVLGLNEADFPERARRDPIDLRLARRSAGDVTPTERDRYLFLEALLAARDRIFLSYLSRDPQTGDPLEPSAAIRELQFILRGFLDRETVDSLTVTHPVSRYDLRYFDDLEPPEPKPDPHQELASFDRAARRGARMAALRANLRRHCADNPLPGRDDPVVDQLAPDVQARMRRDLRIPDLQLSGNQAGAPGEIRLPLSALRKFLECPIQGAARYGLGMVEDEDDECEDHDDEPISQSILDRTIMLREAFWKSRGDRERAIDEYDRAFRLAQARGRAPSGPFAEEARKADLARIREWIDQARAAGAGDLAGWQDVRIARADEFEGGGRLLPEITLNARVDQPDGTIRTHPVKIYGTIGFVSPGADATLQCILRDKAKAKDFLRLFLCGFALAAAGEPLKSFRAIVAGAARQGGAPHQGPQDAAAGAGGRVPGRSRHRFTIRQKSLLYADRGGGGGDEGARRAWNGRRSRRRNRSCARERLCRLQLGLWTDPPRAQVPAPR